MSEYIFLQSGFLNALLYLTTRGHIFKIPKRYRRSSQALPGMGPMGGEGTTHVEHVQQAEEEKDDITENGESSEA